MAVGLPAEWGRCGRSRRCRGAGQGAERSSLTGTITSTVLYASHYAGGGELPKQIPQTFSVPSRSVPKKDPPAMAEWRNLKCAFIAPAVITAKASVIKATVKSSITVRCVTECPKTGIRKKTTHKPLFSHYYASSPTLA